MTALEQLLRDRITQTGPIPLSAFMADCLMHPHHGYYATRDPLGAAGDFTTAPEISQMFGEVLGLCLAQSWADQGAPGTFTLAELGPGRGTLMADLLRATRAVPGFHSALDLHLVETSPHLRRLQAVALADIAVTWHDTTATLPRGKPLFALANEFLDALPVRQFHHSPQGWREVLVGLENGALVLGHSSPMPAPPDPRFAEDPPGTVVELCPDLPGVLAPMAQTIAAHGGAAIFVDYGGWRSKGDTLQALRAHRPTPVLADPGLADLTAHVDFEAVVLAASPCRATGMTDQGALLARLGIGTRAERLARGLSGPALENHLAATRRLTSPQEMGSLFKALAIYSPHCTAPPGFD